MAWDNELSMLVESDQSQAFVRLYRMDPPGITIGRNQTWRAVIDEAACDRRQWDWMRRPTGGGALLHQEEINYAVIAPRSVLDGGRTASFRGAFERVLRALAEVIRHLGHRPTVRLGREGGSERSSAGAHGLCSQSLTRFEITIEGKKAVAAAHRNFIRTVLQHGTLYLKAPTASERFWPIGNESADAKPVANWYSFGWPQGADGGVADHVLRAFVTGFESESIFLEQTLQFPLDQRQIAKRLELWMSEGWRTWR